MVTPFIPKSVSVDSGHSILSPPLHLTSLLGKLPTALLPRWYTGKESACSAGDARDAGLILGLGRLPGEGNGILPQYSCLGNPLDREAWRATVHGVAKSQTRLSTDVCTLLVEDTCHFPAEEKLTSADSSLLCQHYSLCVCDINCMPSLLQRVGILILKDVSSTQAPVETPGRR